MNLLDVQCACPCYWRWKDGRTSDKRVVDERETGSSLRWTAGQQQRRVTSSSFLSRQRQTDRRSNEPLCASDLCI